MHTQLHSLHDLQKWMQLRHLRFRALIHGARQKEGLAPKPFNLAAITFFDLCFYFIINLYLYKLFYNAFRCNLFLLHTMFVTHLDFHRGSLISKSHLPKFISISCSHFVCMLTYTHTLCLTPKMN